MVTSLNEESLLKFLCQKDDVSYGYNSQFVKLLSEFNVDVKNVSTNSIYDIIETYENEQN